MNISSDAMPESPFESQATAPASMSCATRPLYWSVRRELWENRAIYVAPLVAAGLGMLAFLIGLISLPHGMDPHATSDPMDQRVMFAMPYGHMAWLVLPTAFVVGIFYCLDALNGERRDRSILFWKSLPVSDLTTVLAKASIPLVVIPLLVFALIVIMYLIMLPLDIAALLARGRSTAALWTQLPLFQMELVLLYGLIVLALWHAPLYGWLLLVSAWARRATFLWAVLPPAALAAFEWTAFRTHYFASLLGDRLYGFAADAFALHAPGVEIDPHLIPLAAVTPGRFLSTPGLWIGLVFAAIFLAAAARLRRYREPL